VEGFEDREQQNVGQLATEHSDENEHDEVVRQRFSEPHAYAHRSPDGRACDAEQQSVLMAGPLRVEQIRDAPGEVGGVLFENMDI
jgi:hypothetical protein